jgi:peptide/nickel transport system substrate-binding protein
MVPYLTPWAHLGSYVKGGVMDTDRSKNIDHGRLDGLRRGRGPIQEHVIDEFVAGRLSRRDFIRRGSMLGMSMGVLSGILAACGSSGTSSSSSTGTGTGKSGATIKAGIIVPAGAINPITISDQGGLELIGNVGEFLVYTDPVTLTFRPWLATSWSPNADASVWTFKIRQGVKFNDGKPMTVDDVVYSFKQQANPKGSGNALSVFAGTLTPGGVEKVDDTTVAFHLESPDAGWPDAVSENNYNMIIVPNGFDFGTYQKTWPGTGRFMMSSYTANVGATFVRSPH